MKYYMFNGLNEENKSIKPKINKKKVWKTAILLFLILLILIFMFLYTKNEKCREIFDKYLFRKEVYENNLSTIKIDSSKNIEICAYGKYIGVLEQNKLKLYNKTANQEEELDIEIANPIFESNGEYLCIAEKNGQKIYLISNKNIIWQTDIEGNISSVNVNKNGYVSIVISGTTYKTVIETYDKEGNKLFKKYLATTSVIDTDISNDNKYLAIAEVNFSGIVVQSTIKVISIEEAKEGAAEPIKYTHIANADDLIINIKYNNKNQLICMYDEYIDILDKDKNEEVLNFQNEDVLFSDINLSEKIIKIIKRSTGMFSAEAEMQIINTNTNKTTTYTIENVPKKVLVQDDIIAINLGTSALFINNNGWLIKKYKSSQEIQNIVLAENIAGIISKNKIEIVSL